MHMSFKLSKIPGNMKTTIENMLSGVMGALSNPKCASGEVDKMQCGMPTAVTTYRCQLTNFTLTAVGMKNVLPGTVFGLFGNCFIHIVIFTLSVFCYDEYKKNFDIHFSMKLLS